MLHFAAQGYITSGNQLSRLQGRCVLKINVSFRLVSSIWLVFVFFFIQGCSSPLDKKEMVIADDPGPYGEWLLLNPKTMQENLIAGGLIVCREEDKENAVCGDNGYLLVVLEKNFGFGCTDYVSSGSVEYNSSEKQWYLVSDSGASEKEEKLRVKMDGKRLQVIPEDGNAWVFQRSTAETIQQKALRACQKSRSHNKSFQQLPESGF